MKQDLLVNQDRLLSLFDYSSDLVQIVDHAGRFIFVNKTWKYKLAHRDVDLELINLRDIIHPDYLDHTLEQILSITPAQPSRKIETVFQSRYQKNIYVNGQVNGIFSGDSPVEYQCVFYDITERVRAESAQRFHYSIAELTHQEYNLDVLYDQLFKELSSHLPVKNFSIAILLEKSIDYPFRIVEEGRGDRSIDELLARYTLERGKPLIIYGDGIEKIAQENHYKLKSELPKSWLGVPIRTDQEPMGVMMMYSYDGRTVYNLKDLELLDFIAGQVGVAIQRQIAQRKIDDQAARLQAIFESSTHQIWSVDRDLRFTSFNNNYALSFRSYFDQEPELGMNMEDVYNKLYNDEKKDLWISKYRQALQGKIVNFQTENEDKKGNRIWRDVFLNPIFLPDGQIEEVSIIANDITERKLAEETIIEREEKFRNIFESFLDVYFRCSIGGEISMVSPSVRDVLGFGQEEILGRNMAEYFVSRKSVPGLIRRLYSEGSVRNFPGSAKTSEGKRIQFLCNVRLIRKGPEQYEIEGVARDITKLIRTTEQLKKAKNIAEKSLKIKERFLANMSHEIRTPMNGIIGMIDLLGATELDEEQKEYVRTVKKSSDTLLNILNDILDLSKIEAGKMELRLESVSLVETIEKVYALYSQQAFLDTKNLYYHLESDLPVAVLADETRLIQVMSNLISNAIKFSHKKGNIHLGIGLTKETNKGYEFRVSVKDSGIGIDPNDQDKLFLSFSQLDSSNKKLYAGTGLGLAISKELVKSMNGEIGVVSTPGLGSTFWFTFKAGRVDKAVVKDEPADLGIGEAFEGVSPQVLLVDDNDINRKVASQILSKAGCQVVQATDGPDAIHRFTQGDFDLVFMDIQMPEMDGIETTDKLRGIDKEKFPPIVAMTAYSMEEDRAKFLEQGMDDYLAKPIKSNELIEKVKSWTKFEPKVVETKVFEETAKDLIINQNTLNHLFKYGGKELIESVLNEFHEEAETQLRTIQQAFKKKDYEEIRQTLHTLKGNAGTLGIERLSHQAAIVEKRIKENKFDMLKHELHVLNKAFNEFNDSYQNLTTDEQENISR